MPSRRTRSSSSSSRRASLRCINSKDAATSSRNAVMLEISVSECARIRIERRLARLHDLQYGQLLLERRVGRADVDHDLAEIVLRRRGRQAGRGRDQRAAVLCHAERRRKLRHAAFVDGLLNLAHPVEQEPAHQAGRNRQDHGAADGEIELGGDPRANPC